MNGYLVCSVPGCGRFRHDLGRHCKRHKSRRERWGHPLGKRVPVAALAPHLRWWQRFLHDNAEHPEIKRAIASIDRLLRGDVPDRSLFLSWRDHRTPKGLRGQLERVREGGVRGAGILARVGALNRLAFSERPEDVGTLETDDRLTVAMGRAVVFTRARKRHAPPLSGGIYMALGGFLRRQLSGLFADVEIRERESRKKKAPAKEAGAA